MPKTRNARFRCKKWRPLPERFIFCPMKKLPALFITLIFLAPAPRAYCADAKAQLQDLVAKVKTKLQTGKPTEADLAPEFKDFDALLAEHQSEKTDDVANILVYKAMLYAQVFNDNAKATETLQQLKSEFPDTAPAKKADSIMASVVKQEQAKKIQNGLSVGSPFPDFQVTDVDGKPLSVAAEKGKLLLIDFWATWCGPCVQELPNVQKVYAQYHDKGFDIIGVSLDSDQTKLTSFTKEKAMPWPQYFDGKAWDNKLAVTYGINSIPATYLVGKDGKIIGKSLRGSALEDAVKTALAAN